MTEQIQIIDYKVICYSKISFLEQTVCENLQDGWQPLGAFLVYRNDRNEQAFAQAMVRYGSVGD